MGWEKLKIYFAGVQLQSMSFVLLSSLWKCSYVHPRFLAKFRQPWTSNKRFEEKSVAIFPGQNSIPSGVHLGIFQVHLQKVHQRFRRKLPYSAVWCRGVVFFKQGVLVGCKSLQKITKLTSGWGGGYLPPISMLNSQFLMGHIASPIY